MLRLGSFQTRTCKFHIRWGILCLSGMAMCGCGRTPFDSTTSGSANARSGSAHQRVASEEVGAAIARSEQREADERARLASIEASEAGKKATVRTAFPSLQDRRKPQSSSRDPFLNGEADVVQVRPAERTPTNRISFADPRDRQPIPEEQTQVSPWNSPKPNVTQAGVARATQRDGASSESSQNTSAQRPLSRIEQLRAELKQQQTETGRDGVSSTRDFPSEGRVALRDTNTNDRGYPLAVSDTLPARDEAGRVRVIEGPLGVANSRDQASSQTELVHHEEVARRLADSASLFPEDVHPRGRAPIGDARIAQVQQESIAPQIHGVRIPENPTAIRVQSLLAAAEWHLQQGELEQAYRNAMVAQQLTDDEGLTFGPNDRRPVDVSKEVWTRMKSRRELATIGDQQRVSNPTAAVPVNPNRSLEVQPLSHGDLPSIRPEQSRSRPLLEQPVTAPGSPSGMSPLELPAWQPTTLPGANSAPATPWDTIPNAGQQWRESSGQPTAPSVTAAPKSSITLAGLESSLDNQIPGEGQSDAVIHADIKTDKPAHLQTAVTAATLQLPTGQPRTAGNLTGAAGGSLGMEGPMVTTPPDLQVPGLTHVASPPLAMATPTTEDWNAPAIDPADLPALASGKDANSDVPPFPWSIAVVAACLLAVIAIARRWLSDPAGTSIGTGE